MGISVSSGYMARCWTPMKPVPRLRRPPPRDLAAAVKRVIRKYTGALVHAKTMVNTDSRAAPLQDARARLRTADPVMARLIDARPDFDPRAWIAQLPPMDLYGALLFPIVGQQLSVAATRRTLARIEERFGGRLPSAAEVLDTD